MPSTVHTVAVSASLHRSDAFLSVALPSVWKQQPQQPVGVEDAHVSRFSRQRKSVPDVYV